MVQTLHASAVAWSGRAVLIIGASGSGKSALSLGLMGLGCGLVADDRVQLDVTNGRLIASCPPAIAGLIEARGIGILRAEPAPAATVALVVDMDRAETTRLPPRRFTTLSGCDLPLIYRTDAPNFAPSILQLLKSGWSDR